VSLQVVSTVRRDNVQFFTKRRYSALFWLKRTSPGANFHIGGRVCMQLFTYEIMSEIIGLTHAKDCDAYSLWKKRPSAQLFDLHWRVPMQIFSRQDVSVYNLSHNFLCFDSTDMFPRSVLTTRRVHVRVHTLRDGCVHTFLSYQVISMRNVKHMTPCLSQFPTYALETKYHITTF